MTERWVRRGRHGNRTSASTITLEYYACFGRGDYSDTIEWEFDLTDEEYAGYRKAIEDDTPFEDVPLLQAVLDRAFREIADVEADNLVDNEDEYAIECRNRPEPINPFIEGDYDLAVRFAEEQSAPASYETASEETSTDIGKLAYLEEIYIKTQSLEPQRFQPSHAPYLHHTYTISSNDLRAFR